jgi:hypothetical protein
MDAQAADVVLARLDLALVHLQTGRAGRREALSKSCPDHDLAT